MNQPLALITGVTRETGLGFETAKQLISAGYRVIITGRAIDKVALLAAKIGADALGVDISDEKSVAELAALVASRYGKLDVLINNAGAYFDDGGNPLSVDFQFVKDALDTNLLGAWRMINAFYPLLKNSTSARVVNVSSGAGSFADPVFGLPFHQSRVPVYGITKLALNGLTVKMAREFAGTTIKINSVCPGFVATYPGTEAWGARPVTEGARSIVWAVLIPDDGPSGGFFRDGKPVPW